MKIPKEAAPLIYTNAKNYFNGTLTRSQAIAKIQLKYNLNKNSLSDYLQNFKQMMSGLRYTRTSNTFITDYFLTKIYEDFGKNALQKAIIAVEKHTEYYEKRRMTLRRNERAIIKKFKRYNNENLEKIYPDEVESKNYLEGTVHTILVNSFERNKIARRKCIDHYKSICYVCQFNFSKVFGEIGEGFIHVHHLLEISKIKREYRIDPIHDLRPVCPNCHAMIHRKNPAYTIRQIKKLITKHSKPSEHVKQNKILPRNITALV